MNRQQSQEFARHQALQQMEQMKREQLQEKADKNAFSKEYKNELQQQEQFKKMMNKKEQDQDKLYALLEQAQQEKSEVSRKMFFDHMREFQDKNDLKTEALRNFLNGRDWASLSK
jgi:predicted aminopeptidase